MPYFKKMVGSKCYLSPCCAEDAAKWAEWDNDLEIAIPLGDEAYTVYPLEKMRDIVADVIQQQHHVFAIVDLETEEAIGRCMLFDIDHVNRCAMLGIVVGAKEHWDQGYGQEATRLLLDYGFSLLNLNSVMLGTFSFNDRAIQCYRKVGFREVGRRRQARIIARQAYDVVLMDILAEDFESVYVQEVLRRASRAGPLTLQPADQDL
jgi:RimJ/RimL family protein N-acetyltransferase